MPDWFCEAEIQKKIKTHLLAHGWTLIFEANTATRQRGPDLKIEKDSRIMLVEVKGYPSKYYQQGMNQGLLKKTKPAIQARHWFAEALLTLILKKCKNPEYDIAMGLAGHAVYQKKWQEIKLIRELIDMKVFWVNEVGNVESE